MVCTYIYPKTHAYLGIALDVSNIAIQLKLLGGNKTEKLKLKSSRATSPCIQQQHPLPEETRQYRVKIRAIRRHTPHNWLAAVAQCDQPKLLLL